MRAIGTFLIVCVALAVVKAAIAALLLALVIAVIWATCNYPRETFGLLTYCAVMGMISAHPQLVLAVTMLAILGAHIGKKWAKRP